MSKNLRIHQLFQLGMAHLPWSINYAGPFQGKIFVDANAPITIKKQEACLPPHGLPRTVVSDNGSVFTSSEFENFLQKNGICHIRTAPYHQASNGLAEKSFTDSKRKLTEKLNFFVFIPIQDYSTHNYWTNTSTTAHW